MTTPSPWGRKVLSEDDEGDLRAHFCGALEVIAGSRSPLGAMLDRLKFGLPRDAGYNMTPDGCFDDGCSMTRWFQHDDRGLVVYDAKVAHRNVAEDRLIDNLELIRRHRMIRVALNTMPREQVEVLQRVYAPIPMGRVWGLVTAFGDRETAAVAVYHAEVEANDERAKVVATRDAVLVHDGDPIAAEHAPGASAWTAINELRKRATGSPKAKAELASRRDTARREIEQAKAAYAEAIRAVRLAMRAQRRVRFEVTVGLA